MTLVVVHNDIIYCDSFCTHGDSDAITDKVRLIEWTDSCQIEKYTVAGSPDAATAAMEFLATKPASEWANLDLSRFGGCSSFTTIVFRRKGYDRPGIIDLGSERPVVRPVLAPEESGLQLMAGSGWHYFAAFFNEHGDVQKALQLTARYHRDVAEPFQKF